MRTPLRRTRSDALTLEDQPPGSTLRLVSVDGGTERALRLIGLGLQLGGMATVTYRRGGGVVLDAGGGTRVAVGRELARHVRVEPVAATTEPTSAIGRNQ